MPSIGLYPLFIAPCYGPLMDQYQTYRANIVDRIAMKALSLVPVKPHDLTLNQGVVSISFDDAPKSAVTLGAEILARHKIGATFFLNGAHAGQMFEDRQQFDAADVKALHDMGHEIGCHTYDHVSLRAATMAKVAASLDDNLAWAKALLGDDFSFDSFAYPFGAYRRAAQRLVARRFAVARGVYQGVNVGRIDLANLRTLPLEARRIRANWLDDVLAPALARTASQKGWLILFSHDVQDGPTDYGISPDMLAATIANIHASGLRVAPIGQVAREILN